jgi:hypothetical protein
MAKELLLGLIPKVGVVSSGSPGIYKGEVGDSFYTGAVIVTVGVAGVSAGYSSRTVISLYIKVKEVINFISELL